MAKNNGLADNRYFKTSSFYLSVFLLCKGLELININRTNSSRRSTFVFADTPERELWVDRYNYAPEDDPDVKLDIRKFVFALRTLKERLYQDER